MTVYFFLVKFQGVDILLLIHSHKVWNFQIYIYSVIDLKLALHRSRLFFNVSPHQRKCLPDSIRKYYSTWNWYVLPVIIKEFYRLPHSVKKSNLQVYSVMCSQHKPNYTLFDSQAWVQRLMRYCWVHNDNKSSKYFIQAHQMCCLNLVHGMLPRLPRDFFKDSTESQGCHLDKLLHIQSIEFSAVTGHFTFFPVLNSMTRYRM